MTELDMIERAKMYLDKMANGINPLTDAPVPENDLINNVRITRCLFFVSDVLRRTLEGSALQNQTSEHKKVPFALTPEQAARFAYSEQPLRISEIVRSINSLIDAKAMWLLQVTTVTGWLVTVGLLKEESSPDGHTKRVPTEQGRACGITTEHYNRGSYSYETVSYDINAQHFIIDNLDAAVAARAGRTDMNRQPWSEEENRTLANLIKSGAEMKEIAERLKRKTSSVRQHARQLGLLDGRETVYQ